MKLSSIVIMNSMSSWVIEAALLRVDVLGSFTAQPVVDRFEKFGWTLRFELARSSHTAQPQSHLYRLPEFFSDILLPASSKQSRVSASNDSLRWGPERRRPSGRSARARWEMAWVMSK
jgi:hypothetical protein